MTSLRPIITPANAARLIRVRKLSPTRASPTSGQRLGFNFQGAVLVAKDNHLAHLRWWDLGTDSGRPVMDTELPLLEAPAVAVGELVLCIGAPALSPSGLWRPSLKALSARDGSLQRQEFLPHSVTTLCASRDGSHLLAVMDEEAGLLWDVRAWRPVRELPWPEGEFSVTACALSADGRFAAATATQWSDDQRGVLWLWEVASGGQPWTMPIDASTAWSVAFHPREPLLVVGGLTEHVTVVHAVERRLVRTIPGFYGYACNLDFHPEGHLLAASHDGRGFALHHFDTGEVLFRASDGDDLQTSDAVFSPDGRFVAWGQGDGTVGLWAVAD
ncbi:WD40 repeat domain-containing protein [Myxococcus xanthus]|uniref:WD40 repeat domain-containing protein n=1 Tax=Myxococcus xanthus TaxID=34 RepID=UPI00191765A2|nr:WD40 repeat domain-containing protein [Myxococcus xanthus]QQR45752.1 WD40 repeat domain-containing protein [Myxococcus xanthus]